MGAWPPAIIGGAGEGETAERTSGGDDDFVAREGLAEPSCRREASSACTVDRGGAVAFLDSPDIDMRLAGSLLPEVPVVCVLPVDGDF